MKEIRESLFDFSKMAKEAESLSEVLAAQQHLLSADFVLQEGEARLKEEQNQRKRRRGAIVKPDNASS
jgi:hypothetical protein